ncbi:MAG: LysR family transcriptional regulator [Clostridiales bacterium]|nr:LysR family transcriptional regulator [Clostridiales bacterium]
MSLNKYQILSTVVKTGSLTKAAETLYITQSAVSHAIAGLEEEMGFPLLNRNRNGVSLTKNGETVLKHVQEILQCNERLEQKVAMINGLEIGTVNVGTFTSVSTQWLPYIFDIFSKLYPKIEVNMFEGDYDELNQMLESRLIDFTFLSASVAAGFETIFLKDDEILCIMSDNHPLASRKSLTFEDIKDQQFILPKYGKNAEPFIILKEAGIEPNVRYSMSDDQAIMSFVQKGFGIALMPEMILYHRPLGTVKKQIEGAPKRSICLASHSFKDLSPSAKKLVKTILSWVLPE